METIEDLATHEMARCMAIDSCKQISSYDEFIDTLDFNAQREEIIEYVDVLLRQAASYRCRLAYAYRDIRSRIPYKKWRKWNKK